MFGYKQFVRYFLYVITFFYTFHIPINAAQTQDIPSLYSSNAHHTKLTSSHRALDNVALESPPLSGLNADMLETAFSQTSRIALSPPARRVVGALAAAFASVASFQTLVPMGMIGLGELGLTADILPPDSEGANAVVAVMALTPLIMGGEATYHGVIKKFKSLAPEVLEALKIVYKRDLSKLES